MMFILDLIIRIMMFLMFIYMVHVTIKDIKSGALKDLFKGDEKDD